MSPVSHLYRFRRFARKFVRQQGGATAVEFAIVLLPFLMLLLGIVELALIFTVSVALDNAVVIASRQVRTGELTSPSDSGQVENARLDFRDEVCAHMGFLQADCETQLTVDVRTVSQFSDINLSDPISDGAFDPGALTFDTGGASTIVLVRAYYRWNLFAPLMNDALTHLPGQTLLTSVTTFRTEPYDL